MSTTDDPLDPLLRRRTILRDLGVHPTTLDDWIKKGRFPEPIILNPGEAREICAWPQSVYLAWKQNLPQRRAKTPRRRRKLITRPPV